MIHDTMNHTDYVEIIVLLTMCIKIESLSQAFSVSKMLFIETI